MGVKEQTKQKWRGIVLAQKTSGLYPIEFCRQNNICRPSFYQWRKMLGMADEAAGSGMIAIPGKDILRTKNLPRGFIRVMPPIEKTEGICVETPNGYQVKTGQIGESGLKSVLEMLRGI